MRQLQASTGEPGKTGPAGRDLVVTAMILGVAAMMWFGWGQAAAPAGWPVPLAAGSVAGIAAAAGAGMVLPRYRHGPTAMSDRQVRRGYLRIVGLELAAIGAGVAGLAAAGQSRYLPAWILLVVGIHFLPLARLFGTPGLAIAGVTLTAVALAAAALGAAGAGQPSTVAGAGGGVVCLTGALSCLWRARLPEPVPQCEAGPQREIAPQRGHGA